MSLLRRALLTLVLTSASAGFLQAQSVASEPATAPPAVSAATASSQMEAAARLQASPSVDAVRAEETPVPAEAAVAVVSDGGKGTATALMIVGAAALVTGLIIEEDGLTIAGAIVGLVGLYLHLK
jgi:hypothetical protein